MGQGFFWFRRERLVFTASLTLAALCLSFYVNHLWGEWVPIIKKHSILAPRLSAPIAQDFIEHWTASHLTLAGEQATVYNAPRFKEIEQDLTGLGGHPWPYPPTALLIDWPLALLPYIPSLATWLVVTMGLYLLVLYRIAPHPLTLFWGLAFFGTFQNFYFGQNGFLSAALLGGGLLLLDGSPFLGGVLLGLLSYKPHLAALVPLALLAGRRWRALSSTVVAAICLALASLAVLGFDTWELFLKTIPHAMNNLYTQSDWFFKMPTIFAAVRLAGFGVPVAWGLHGVAMLVAVALVVWLWSVKASAAVRVAALAIGILLFSPHIWFYDLPILAIALAWLGWEGHTKGWLPLEQLLLLISWLIPFVSFLLEVSLRWPNGPLYLIPPLILMIRRHRWEKQQFAAGQVVFPSS